MFDLSYHVNRLAETARLMARDSSAAADTENASPGTGAPGLLLRCLRAPPF